MAQDFGTVAAVVRTQSIMRRAHIVGSSIVITIAPALAQKFQAADPLTFFEEIETPEGILLKPRRLSP